MNLLAAGISAIISYNLFVFWGLEIAFQGDPDVERRKILLWITSGGAMYDLPRGSENTRKVQETLRLATDNKAQRESKTCTFEGIF